MRRLVGALLLALALAGCGQGESEEELPPGTLTIGIATGGPNERLIARGAQVAADQIDNAGGIGGILRVDLLRSDVRALLARRVHFVLLPCDPAALGRAARAVERRGALGLAPCDDGVVPQLPRIFPTGLSPRAQAAALDGYLDGEGVRSVSVAPPETPRAHKVAAALGALLDRRGTRILASQRTRVSPEALVGVRPPPGVVEGTVFATYGFPEPGSETDEFYERYKALFGERPPSVIAALGAEALDVLAVAVETAVSVDPQRVAAELRRGLVVGGVLGEIEFPGGTSRPQVPAVVLRVENGRLRVVARR